MKIITLEIKENDFKSFDYAKFITLSYFSSDTKDVDVRYRIKC